MLLKLEDICKWYPVAGGRENRIILNNLNLQVEKGERLAIAGPSGSGKTTLLNLIGTLDHPNQGRLLFAGQDLSLMNDQELARFRNRRIGFIFQSHHLLPQLTLWENILVPTLPAKDLQGKETIKRAQRLLERTG